ncbi:uncharacterized protein LOC126661687 [Mercurialis annua]|uniref:uncharacterized protein LOC126661687 n=1 Tax=Mercurialis annua TaxID=3986 RepID=UPI00215EA64B|nr:uncharacterized protein LOC126661687 [Mercurialis annua]
MHKREYLTEADNAWRQNEFIAQKQGSMAVREYINRFEELYRFKEGLQTVLKNELSLYEGTQFRGWVEKSIENEKLREELQQEKTRGSRGNRVPWSWSGSQRSQSNDSNFSARQPTSTVSSVFSSGRGRGYQGTVNRGGRTSGFDRGYGRGSRFNANKEGGASTSTQPMLGTQITRPVVQPNVFALTPQEAVVSLDVTSGRLTIFSRDAYVLTGPGVTHSFIVSSFISCIPRDKSVMNHALVVDLPVGQSVVCQHVYKDCEIQIGDPKFEVDLVPFPH